MKRNFKRWLDTFRESISTYKYYTDFKKVVQNVDNIKVELNILNSLIGSTNIKKDFIKIVQRYPETLACIPILLAVRGSEIKAGDDNGYYNYSFDYLEGYDLSIEQYCYFMKETGLFDMLKNHIVSNLIDYVTGVETGLDSNGRKNRGGHLMEDLVEKYIVNAGYKKGRNYFKEMYISEITDKFGIDMSAISNKGKNEKRFDFVIKTPKMVYGIETNFYTSSGSKLNETARSYKTIAQEAKQIPNFTFIWITDGAGWKSAKGNLEETFDVLDTLYNIKDLDNGILENLK